MSDSFSHIVMSNSQPSFEEINVSTKTFITVTNLTINILQMHEELPLAPYIETPRQRGKKSPTPEPDPNAHLIDGSIITSECEGRVRGASSRRKKSHFRNSVTIVMIVAGKKINFKVSRNGKMQMTGCKEDAHTISCIQYFWEVLQTMPHNYELNGDHFEAIIVPAMRNVDFRLGFSVNRQNLDRYINTSTEFHSLLETSVGYAGVNIKLPVEVPFEDIPLCKLVCEGGRWVEHSVPYSEYLDTLKPREKQKKLEKEHHNTFLVFASGSAICSGRDFASTKPSYDKFAKIIEACKDRITIPEV